MITKFLVRGMLIGIFAGLLSFGFAKVFGEPPVDKAIAFEEHMDKMEGKEEEPELVSREVQSSWGLLTAVTVYGTAIGGLYALAFSVAYGRVGNLRPRTIAMLLAGAGFLAIVLIPNLKYPANPPSVGQPDTIGMRTGTYFTLIALTLATLAISVAAARQLVAKLGTWNATLVGGAIFIAMISSVMYLLPSINEVPEAFSAVLLWQFRVASLGTQLVLWSVMGLMFGAFTERSLKQG